EYAQLVAALKDGTTADEVELHAYDDSGLVPLRDADAGTTLITPAGTSALVLEWPKPFVEGSPGPPAEPVQVPVKLLDGPAAGRVLTVDARAIRLTAKDGTR